MIDGKPDSNLTRIVLANNGKTVVRWKADSKNHSIYAKVRDKNDNLILFSNPIYIRML